MNSLVKLFLVVVAIAGGSLLVADRFWLQVIALTLIWATAGIAWNLPATAGQISLGHSAFTGIGAYTFVLLKVNYDVSPWLGMGVGMILAAVVAVALGIPTFRLQGFYFTLATLAFPLILILLVVHWGYPEVSVPLDLESGLSSMQFRDTRAYVWIALGMFVVTMLVGLAIHHSRFGTALRAIKDNEVLARSVGVSTLPWKLGAFAISAAVCAAVGVVWVNAILLVVTAEELFGLNVVILMISVAFVGGIGSPWGPFVGALLLVPLGQYLTAQVGAQFPGAEQLIYGLALVAAALVVPRGIVPTLSDWSHRRRLLRAPGEPAADEARDESPADAERPAPARSDVAGRKGTKDGRVVLELSRLEKHFGGVNVLADVSFHLQAGSRVGLIGPNGAGKTTLFNLLTGHLRPDGGKIIFEGKDIARARAPERYRMGISRTFQVPQGFSSMTPWENVRIAATGLGVGTHDDAVDAALARVGLTGKAHLPLSTMTTFDFKLLELARATVGDPSLLLLDEPLAGLNKSERRSFFEILDRAVTEETTVVIIEHSVRSLVSFADDLVALDQGKVVASGKANDVVSDPKVVEAYLGKRWADHSTSEQPTDVEVTQC